MSTTRMICPACGQYRTTTYFCRGCDQKKFEADVQNRKLAALHNNGYNSTPSPEVNYGPFAWFAKWTFIVFCVVSAPYIAIPAIALYYYYKKK